MNEGVRSLKTNSLGGGAVRRVIIHSQVAADTLLYFNENGYTAWTKITLKLSKEDNFYSLRRQGLTIYWNILLSFLVGSKIKMHFVKEPLCVHNIKVPKEERLFCKELF